MCPCQKLNAKYRKIIRAQKKVGKKLWKRKFDVSKDGSVLEIQVAQKKGGEKQIG